MSAVPAKKSECGIRRARGKGRLLNVGQQERGEAVALLNAFAPLLQVRPDINIKPILERVANAYEFDNPEELFQAPQQAPPAEQSVLPLP